MVWKISFLFLIFFSSRVISENYSIELGRAYAPYKLSPVREKARFIDVEGTRLHFPEPTNAMTFTDFGINGVDYALYENLLLRGFNFATKKYEGTWVLNQYPELSLEGKVKKKGVSLVYEYTDIPGSGCLLKYPLRYADIDGDGKIELVILFSGNTPNQENVVIFSPEKGRVVFASVLMVDRAMDSSPEVLEQLYPDWNGSSEYQYSYDEGRSPPSLSMGYRSFGKHFFGDINADGKQDIILWRKYFESLLNGDAKKGFAKKDELFVHYSLVDGEYKKQSTAADTIKGWLAAKQLSWQQGFPSRSECPGQEGQLIPELHDPLLNDPDVLH